MNLERAALLKCRAAGRYDNLGDAEHRSKPTPEQAAEEQAASYVKAGDTVYRNLEEAGLLVRLSGNRLRLTDAGREKLGEPLGTRLVVIGNEGSLNVTALEPTRFWAKLSRLGESKRRVEERVMLGAHNFAVKGRTLSDGSYFDRMSQTRKLFYCRILPEEAREELAAIDGAIVEAEKTLARLRQERQELLSAAARRGAKVPMPPRTEPKPEAT